MTISARSVLRSRWFLVTVLYVGLTLAYSWPLLPVIGSALPNDAGDPGLNTWILWWNAHAVPLTERWWDAPMFFPARGSLALSETFLNLVVLSSPLQWAGASAVLTYNLLFLLSFPAAALAAHALGRQLTGRHDAALLAGLAFGFAPYRAAQMPHLQALWSCWMPLALFALHRFVTTRRTRELVLFGLCWMMNGFSTGYYLVFFSVLVGLWMLWFIRSRRDWVMIGVTILVASVPLVPLLVGYQRYQDAFGVSRTVQEIESFSADLSAIWATTPYVWPFAWTFSPRPEGELYPGATILLLSIVGAVVIWRRLPVDRGYRARTWIFAAASLLGIMTGVSWYLGGWTVRLGGMTLSLTRPARTTFFTVCLLTLAVGWSPRLVQAWRRRSRFLFYSVATVVMLLFALGPVGRLFGVRFLVEGPYAWLMALPGGHALRVPARFSMLFVMCLAEAAALAFSLLTPLGARAPIVAALGLAIALEGFVARMETAKVPAPIDFHGLATGAAVLELPLEDYDTDTDAMLRATQVGVTLVNGFSGYRPPHYQLLQEGLGDLDGSILTALQQSGPLLVFVRHKGDPNRRYRTFLDGIPDAHLASTIAAGTLYRLPSNPVAPLAAHPRVKIASIRIGSGESGGTEMTDGDLATHWSTRAHQKPGSRVEVVLDRSVTISGLEIDLGHDKNDFPRTLRVSVSEDGENAVTAWEGSTAGLVLMATLEDRRRMPLRINLPPSTHGRRIVLEIVDAREEFLWSIAELTVFGR